MSEYWHVPRLWEGQTAFILGCGPSLSSVDFNALRGLAWPRVIAINDAIFEYPEADLLYFCDRAWWDGQYGRQSRVPRGTFIVTLENEIAGVKRLRNTGPTGFDPDTSCLRHGSNSGYQAMHLAVHLGVKRIILCGFDLRTVDGRLHSMARPEQQAATPVFDQTLREAMLPKFETLVEPLSKMGVQVLNATPGSRLTCWPIVEAQVPDYSRG